MNVILNNILEKELFKKEVFKKDFSNSDLSNNDLSKKKDVKKINYWYKTFINYHTIFCKLITTFVKDEMIPENIHYSQEKDYEVIYALQN